MKLILQVMAQVPEAKDLFYFKPTAAISRSEGPLDGSHVSTWKSREVLLQFDGSINIFDLQILHSRNESKLDRQFKSKAPPPHTHAQNRSCHDNV
jgi:hypothetical protein